MYIMILCHANSDVAFKRMTLMSKCLKSSHFCKIFDISSAQWTFFIVIIKFLLLEVNNFQVCPNIIL